MEEQKNITNNNQKEFDLIDIIRYLWQGRWLIIKLTCIFIVIGFLIAFTSTVQFKAESRILPELKDYQSGPSQFLRQFSAIGGVSIPLKEGADAIQPNLYPDVLNSTPFFMSLMDHEIRILNKENNEKISVYNYIQNYMPTSIWAIVVKYTIRLPWTIKGWISSEGNNEMNYVFLDELPQMSLDQVKIANTLRKHIDIEINQKTNIISVAAEFPDRIVAAQVAQFALDYLTEYITKYRTEKAKKDLEFITKRHDEKRKDFYETQLLLAQFHDANRNIVSAAVEAEEQRLLNQYNLVFNVYNSLSQQLEQARIKVQEETPVIKVLDPVMIPAQKSKPRRMLILIKSVFIGAFCGAAFILIKKISEIYWKSG